MTGENMKTELAHDIQARLDGLAQSDNWAVEAADLLLEAAGEAECSDLHLTCTRDAVLARVRRDGTLVPIARIHPRHRDYLLARFKVLARLPAFVRHEPQDGRIEWRSAAGASTSAEPVILRVSFLPTIHGESMVIRFPEARALAEGGGLDSLGMPEDVRRAAEGLVMRQEGTLLLTGPSSSGKTTTIYAMLEHIHQRQGDRANIVTIEDPIERDLGFASQVQVNEAQGVGFARALRAALRQDPNVLMIGEIRDAETARVAIQAGMTGHFVISTLHAGRAAQVFSRLVSVGIEPYMMASAMTGALAQRLARKLCQQCRRPDGRGWTTEGCAACGFTGYEGRIAIFELIAVDEPLREAILARSTTAEVALAAERCCIGSIPDTLRRRADEGVISLAERDALLAGDHATEDSADG